MEIKEFSVGVQMQKTPSIVLGVSINNSLFTNNEYLIKILMWASLFSKNIYIMIPDEPAMHTLRAIGYEEKKAESKARLKSNNIQNRFNEIFKTHQVVNVTIIRWRDIVGNLNYQNSLIQIKKSYENDVCFKKALRMTTSEVLLQSLSREPKESEIDIGVGFLFEELAFICNATHILNKEQVVYVYHKTMVVMKSIFDEKYSFRAASGTGFLTVNE